MVDGPEDGRSFDDDDSFASKYCYVLEIVMSKEATDDSYWYDIGVKVEKRVKTRLQLLVFVLFQFAC